MKVDYASTEFETLSEDCLKLLAQFAWKPDERKPCELFELLYDFAKDFTDAYKKMIQNIKAEEAKLKKAAKKAQPRATVCEIDTVSVAD